MKKGWRDAVDDASLKSYEFQIVMRRILYSQTLVLLLFVGITAGNALPYAELYQLKTTNTFTCHCCRGKVTCPRCARYGHRHGLDEPKTAAQAAQQHFKDVPCSTSHDNPKSLNFSQDPFVMVPVQPILMRPRLLPIPEQSDVLSPPHESPSTPPPQYTA